MGKRIEIVLKKDETIIDVTTGGAKECEDASILLQAIMGGLGVECGGQAEKKPQIPEATQNSNRLKQ